MEKEQKRTPIETVGEFGLIDLLTKDIVLKNPTSVYGVGDDCAILDYKDKQTVITSDMLMEGIHFNLTYCPLKHLGYKSAVVNFSDVYAMNAIPQQLIVNIAIAKHFTIEDLETFYDGVKLACAVYGVDLVGGDTTSSFTGFAISMTCIGAADKSDIVYRNGAKDTDLICVTGDLGAAYMGLQILVREEKIYQSQQKENLEGATPDFTSKEYILERQLKPEAQKKFIEDLKVANIKPTAMMDISDGLSSELIHICKQSKVGCRLYEGRLPIDYQTAVTAEELNINVSTCALNGGEDYEMVFTVPLALHDDIQKIEGVHVIGHITKPELGYKLVTRDDNEFDLKAQGWKSNL